MVRYIYWNADMIFDLTPEIKLGAGLLKLYRFLRAGLFLFFLASGMYFLSLLFFPAQHFFFSMNNPKARSNTVAGVAIGGRPETSKGLVGENQKLDFTAPSSGFFSRARINFKLDRKSSAARSGKIILRKSFRAFLYPDGDPKEVADYLDRRASQTIGDGSLVSYGGTIYAISGNQILPVDSPETFLALGYDWETVIPVDGGLYSSYEKGPALAIHSAHPDGTVFLSDSQAYYLVKDGRKYPLAENFQHLPVVPVLVSERSLETKSECALQRKIFPFREYECLVPLAPFRGIYGKDYAAQAEFGNEIKIESIKVELKRDWTAENARISLDNIIRRSKENYVPQN